MNMLDEYLKLSGQYEKLDNGEVVRKGGESGPIILTYNPDLDLYTAKYRSGGEDFSNPYIRSARWLTIDPEGNVVLRGFDKFFNYMQLETYESYSEQFKDQYSRMVGLEGQQFTSYEKLDGTMILLSTYKGNFIVSTTSSTNNTFTQKALKYFNALDVSEELKKFLSDQNVTLIFEYISPFNQIVVEYDKDDYVLLGIAKNGMDGRSDLDYREIAKKHGFTIPKESHHTIDELLFIQKNTEGIEGFVVINEFGNRIKFKTEYWFQHSGMAGFFFGPSLTKTKIRLFLEAVKTDTLDDLYARQNSNQMYKKDNYICALNNEFKSTKGRVDQILDQYKDEFHDNSVGLRKAIAQDDSIVGMTKSMIFRRLSGDNWTDDSLLRIMEKYLIKTLLKNG